MVVGVGEETWARFDRYVNGLLEPADPVLEGALESIRRAGLPAISVSAAQGRLLHLLARSVAARAILEIGTLGGYSTIWLARALPAGGRLVTLEADPGHAAVARANIAAAGLSEVVELRLGRAEETLPALAAESPGAFDLVFLDADKAGYAEYLGWTLRLTHPGSLIVADNVVRGGRVADPEVPDPGVEGIRRFFERVARTAGVETAVLQTVGDKGYDGLALILIGARA